MRWGFFFPAVVDERGGEVSYVVFWLLSGLLDVHLGQDITPPWEVYFSRPIIQYRRKSMMDC